MTGMGLFGSSKKRSRDAAAVITGAGSGIGAAFAVELARKGGRVVCSDIDENAARATADAINSRRWRCLGTALRRVTDRRRALPGRRRTGLVRRSTDNGDQQRRRRRRWPAHRRGEPRRLAVGTRHQPVGADPRLPCLRTDPSRGRLRRNHQRRIGCGIRRRTGDGRLQRQQGRACCRCRRRLPPK